MKKGFIIMVLVGSSALLADTALPGGPASIWQVVPNSPNVVGGNPTTAGGVITSPTSNAAGNAYWNNASADAGLPTNTEHYLATDCFNIGCFMTGSGVWASSNPTVNGSPNLSPNLDSPVYLGNPDGSSVTDFHFSAGGVQNPATMLAELAGPTDRDWMGWYDSSLGSVAAAIAAGRGVGYDIIFSAFTGVGSTASFNPTTNFGLFFFDAPPGQEVGGALTTAQIQADMISGAYYTQSSKNQGLDVGTPTAQHFAVFATSAAAGGTLPTDFWVGVEDLPGPAGSGSDRDMNDMIVHLRVVPEPGYFVLLSLGLGGLGLVRRRLQKSA